MALDGAAQICAECSEVELAIRAAKSEQPDIALIGREIAGDWRAAVRGVCRAAPQCRVIVLAQTSDADDMLESVRAGALGLRARRVERREPARSVPFARVPAKRLSPARWWPRC